MRIALLLLLVGLPAPAAERLVIISPHNEAIRDEFGRAFSAWHAGEHGAPVEVDWRVVGGTSESLRFVLSEFARKPEGIGLDIFFGGGQEPYLELAAKGLAQPHQLPPEILDGVPAEVAGIELRAADGAWFGSAISSFGILQNLRVQQLAGLPSVTRWEDLARPELLGWVGAGDPRNSGTMNVMFESFLQFYGWEKGWQLLTQLAGNTRRFDRVSAVTARDATLGESAYALAVDFYAFTQVAAAGRTNMSFILPADFAAINPDGIAILRGAPHVAAAARFVDFVMSDDGQKLWFLPRGHPGGPQRSSIERMPVRPALYERFRDVSNVQFSPFDLPGGFRYDARLGGRRRGVVAALAGALFVDLHPNLQRAWRGVIARGLDAGELADFGRMPLTEEQALALSGEPWKQPAERNARRTEWQRWGRAKYARLTGGAAAAR
ncbi:MAG: ABC transporter substrate-binding protein [Limisphaerales bacterium]